MLQVASKQPPGIYGDEIQIQRSHIECAHSCQEESKWWECSKILVGEICSNHSKAGSNSDSELSSEALVPTERLNGPEPFVQFYL